MGGITFYREELKAMAHSLDQEGLSQIAIAKELGVPRPTITRWLKGQIGQNDLSTAANSRYLVFCQSVEKFHPLDGITFPLIIAVHLNLTQTTIHRWLNHNSRSQLNHNIQHLEGDCLEILPTLPDKLADVLLTDPPYSIMNDYEWDKKDNGFYQM